MKETRTAPQVNLRMAPDLKTWLAAKAESSHRSLTGEITVALEEYRERHQKQEGTQHAQQT